MSHTLSLDDMELAALISSRICHDAIGPVGAIANGLEVLDENPDESMREFALDTIRKSANSASSKLQFARLAYGAAGSMGAEIPMEDIKTISKQFLEQGRHELIWETSRASLPKHITKLLLNLLAIGHSMLPRGGTLLFRMEAAETGDKPAFEIKCTGKRILVPDNLGDLLAGNTQHHLDSKSIQPYYAGRIARETGINVEMRLSGEDTVLIQAS